MKQEEIDELDKFMANEGVKAEMQMLDDHSDAIASIFSEEPNTEYHKLFDGIKAENPNIFADSDIEKSMISQIKSNVRKIRDALKAQEEGNLNKIK